MKVRVITKRALLYEGKNYQPGQILEVADDKGRELIRHGHVEKYEAPGATPEKSQTVAEKKLGGEGQSGPSEDESSHPDESTDEPEK